MTREEILNGLYDIKNWHCNGNSEMYSVITEVIEVLKQEPCEDVIYRQAALDLIKGFIADATSHGISPRLDPDYVMDGIKALPSVTPQPKTGHWIAYEVRLPDRTILNYRCSVCGRKLIGYNTETLSEAPFCHCGAKMVEPQERSEE